MGALLMALMNAAMLIQGGMAAYDTYKKMKEPDSPGTRSLNGENPGGKQGYRIVSNSPNGPGTFSSGPEISAGETAAKGGFLNKLRGGKLRGALKGNKMGLLFGAMALSDLLGGLGGDDNQSQQQPPQLDPQLLAQLSQMQQMQRMPGGMGMTPGMSAGSPDMSGIMAMMQQM